MYIYINYFEKKLAEANNKCINLCFFEFIDINRLNCLGMHFVCQVISGENKFNKISLNDIGN